MYPPREGFDPDALIARSLNPARARRRECLAWACARIPSARVSTTEGREQLWIPPAYDRLRAAESWEALASDGLIPASWPGSLARCFAAGVVERADPTQRRYWLRAVTADGPVRDAPCTVRDALAMAADAPAVAAVEALAGELAERFAPWCSTRTSRVLWVVGDEGNAVARYLRIFRLPLWQVPLEAACSALSLATGASSFDGGETLVSSVHQWDQACARALRVPDPARVEPYRGQWPAALAGREFRSLPDPIAPVLAMLELGVRPLGYDASHPALIVLARAF